MSAKPEHSRRVERRWLPPLLLFATTVLMVVAYRQLPFIPAAWTESGRLLFWGVIGVMVLASLVQGLIALLPERQRTQWAGLKKHRVYIPREGLVYLVIMVVLFVGSLLGHTNMLMLVFAMLAGPFVINGWTTYGMLNRCQISRSAPRRAMSGELFAVELTLHNPRNWLSLWMMHVRDGVNGTQESLEPSVLFTCVPPRGRRVGHYTLRLRHRGIYRFGPLHVASRFPLGLIERGRDFHEQEEIRVYPRAGRLTEQARQRLLGPAELISDYRSRPGSFHDEFHHLRDFRAGDNPRAIHWRSSARRGSLILRAFQQNREQHLALIIDLWQGVVNTEAFERTEWALCLATSLCLEQRRRARDSRCTVYASGQTAITWEGRVNSASLESLFDQLAVIQAGPAEQTAALLEQAWQRGAAATNYLVITTRTRDVEAWFAELLRNLPSHPGQKVQCVAIDPARTAEWLLFDKD